MMARHPDLVRGMPVSVAGNRSLIPFETLVSPTDCLFFAGEGDGEDLTALQRRLGSRIARWCRGRGRSDYHFVTRQTVDQNGVPGVGIWRKF
jgi:hypothetical protein